MLLYSNQCTLVGLSDEPSGTLMQDLLGLRPEDGLPAQPSLGRGDSSTIRFFAVDLGKLQGHAEPREEFDARLQREFAAAAAWLRSRRLGAFGQCRAAGLRLDLVVESLLTSSRLQLGLPAELVSACGAEGLPIDVWTRG
jgi:hypothetical protein